ncbi:MAG: hypothetical protein FD146_1017 [Anaerolineaceae bacterium]|nr:MAG: hypothetical protein FD146_1017 [Anaerolineaceae bacterium]
MTAIAGIASHAKSELVDRMLDKMSHRGWAWRDVIEERNLTFGAIGLGIQKQAHETLKKSGLACDSASEGHFAQAQAAAAGFELKRDLLGVTPLYYGRTNDGELCFASEVKGLLEATCDVHEMPPGNCYDGLKMETYARIAIQDPLDESPETIAAELRRRLETAIEKRIGDGRVGAWLSGGLDSSTLAALARKHVSNFHTFAVGSPGAPDLEFARAMVDFIKSAHHEVIVGPEDILRVLPDVIYHLESFDALLVRSSVMNFLVAKCASDFVPAVFSGEGGDELFAGYEYLKALDPDQLPAELVDITNRLHNTALQRVDRCAYAFGTVAHVGFLDSGVVEYALRIPAQYKLRQGIEKWILRQAMADALPDAILNRTKAKFWQGAGVEDMLARHADEKITGADFARERGLPDGSRLNSKEELMYYRIFKEHFGEFDDLSWVGRTKGAPVG